MTKISIPQDHELNAANKAIFEQLKKNVGFVPNIYALMAHSETALDSFLQFDNAPNSFSKKEIQLIKLVVSQQNECRYCLSAHTVFGEMNGFSNDQMQEIRTGSASFNKKLNALAVLTKEISAGTGRASDDDVHNFFDAGYSKGALIELVHIIGAVTVTNYLNNLTQIPIDFAPAPSFETQTN